MLSVRYSIHGKEGKTVTLLRRLQAKGETSTLHKDTNIMRKIYQSFRVYDKNCFQKKYHIIIIVYIFKISAVVMVLGKESMIGKNNLRKIKEFSD